MSLSVKWIEVWSYFMRPEVCSSYGSCGFTRPRGAATRVRNWRPASGIPEVRRGTCASPPPFPPGHCSMPAVRWRWSQRDSPVARTSGCVKWRGAVVIYSRRTQGSESGEELVEVPTASFTRVFVTVCRWDSACERSWVSPLYARYRDRLGYPVRVVRKRGREGGERKKDRPSCRPSPSRSSYASREEGHMFLGRAGRQSRRAVPRREITCRYRPSQPLPVPSIKPLIRAARLWVSPFNGRRRGRFSASARCKRADRPFPAAGSSGESIGRSPRPPLRREARGRDSLCPPRVLG